MLQCNYSTAGDTRSDKSTIADVSARSSKKVLKPNLYDEYILKLDSHMSVPLSDGCNMCVKQPSQVKQ